MTTCSHRKFPFLKLQRFCFLTYHLFTRNLSPVLKCPVAGMFVLLPSIEKRIYSSIFNTHLPWPSGALGFISEMTQTDTQVCKLFSTNSAPLQYIIHQIRCSNCVTPIELSFKFTCTSWPQEQALSLSWSNLLSN